MLLSVSSPLSSFPILSRPAGAGQSLLFEVCGFSTMASGQLVEGVEGLPFQAAGSGKVPNAKGPLCPGIESTGHTEYLLGGEQPTCHLRVQALPPPF